MYTQLEEEKYILEAFKKLKENGIEMSNRVLDIGCNDGQTISNTRALLLEYPELECYFVEPNPYAFEKLKSLYESSHHHLYSFAIGVSDTVALLYCSGHHFTEADTGLLSTIVESETKRWGENEKWEHVEVEVVKYPFADISFDFISIDTEGMDEKILKQIDLSKTHILCIEWNSVDEVKISIDEYCSGFGMHLIHENGINLIYAKL